MDIIDALEDRGYVYDYSHHNKGKWINDFKYVIIYNLPDPSGERKYSTRREIPDGWFDYLVNTVEEFLELHLPEVYAVLVDLEGELDSDDWSESLIIYNKENKSLVLDRQLPSLEHVYNLAEIRNSGDTDVYWIVPSDGIALEPIDAGYYFQPAGGAYELTSYGRTLEGISTQDSYAPYEDEYPRPRQFAIEEESEDEESDPGELAIEEESDGYEEEEESDARELRIEEEEESDEESEEDVRPVNSAPSHQTSRRVIGKKLGTFIYIRRDVRVRKSSYNDEVAGMF